MNLIFNGQTEGLLMLVLNEGILTGKDSRDRMKHRMRANIPETRHRLTEQTLHIFRCRYNPELEISF